MFVKVLLVLLSVLLLSGCNTTGTLNKEGAGVDTTLKVDKAPVITSESEVFNIKDFGATGDGKTDDFESINYAVDFVSQSGGGVIYFPPGKYLVNSSLDIKESNVVFAGNPDRKRDTIIQSGRMIDDDFITITGSNVQFTYLSIRNMSLNGSVFNVKSDNCVFTDCDFMQWNTKNENTTLVVSGSDNRTANCYFGPNTTNGYIVNFTKEPGRNAKNNTLADCYLGGGLPKSVLIDTNDPGNCPENILISRNVFLFNAIGQVYVVAANNLKIHNNMLDSATTAIILNPDSTGIKNVDIRNNYMGSKNSDVDMFKDRTDMAGGVVTDTMNGGYLSNVVIEDNYFWGYYGIRITSDKFTDFSIVNNYFVESNGCSIYIDTSVNNRIEGNIIYAGAKADYTVYIGVMDDKSVFKYNSLSGECSIPNFDSIKALNFF